MPTYAVRCPECGDTKWPTLPARPDGYVCVLCRGVGATEATKRRDRSQWAAQTRKARHKAPKDRT